MSLRADDIGRMYAYCRDTSALWDYLPPPLPLWAEEVGGWVCICGATVDFGAMHAHGSAGCVVTDPKRWGL